MKNFKRSYTTASRYSSSRHYHISIRSVVFQTHICSWLRHVTGCFFLHSNGLRNAFVLFQSAQVLHLVNDSDEVTHIDVSPEQLSMHDKAVPLCLLNSSLKILMMVSMTISRGYFGLFSIHTFQRGTCILMRTTKLYTFH